MALATVFRPALRSTGMLKSAARPSLSSRLPGRRPLIAPFAPVHTTSPKPQEAAALREDPDVVVRQAAVPRSTAPSVDDLNRSLDLLSSSSNDLTRRVEESLDALRHPLRYESPKDTPHLLHVTDATTNRPRAVLDAAWLRDRCPCPLCVSPSSGNKAFATTEIPSDVAFDHVQQSADGALQVRWANDIPRAAAAEHVSVFPAAGADSIRAMTLEKPVLFARHTWAADHTPKLAWTSANLAPELLRVDYADFLAGGPSFRDAALSLSRIGLLFLTNVPKSETAVADIALRFGAVKETFYGRTWDVISKPDAENVAYTSAYLGLHSDMLYLESPPRIQLLHCLENSCSGGESIFSDAFHASSYLLRHAPDHYRQLCDTKVPYHYNRNGFFYRQARPVISHSEHHHLREVWWSPPFQAPFPLNDTPEQAAAWSGWLAAARAFQDVLEAPDNVFQYKLRPGECVIFDNRRVLHGRRAFDTGSGRRWLKGTYVADEDFKSILRGISRVE
ncbi:TfdA family Taurine catabolism dioxygenase TauD [Colletotrichum higginsianum IMI 349063]|uniref:TfdA family Taurine catabolism dioxygenase TauD n=1 Tax=Colletotrichum higginsianum (strain IMI 349063) TaxID=759273 RepID=A0A1B7YI00_COLHI|nr:TfdA family Taurine catabolism dioxygenase TauD [Colletotrichum higginsianum IMI 349063]OBR11592.1 TfdA family Taurine catabolism dioxygenase TauD [Colletotrichum higginsianum IMI 349063]